MRTGTGTGNGKREMGNGKQGTEEEKMRTKPFYQKPHCRFSILICSHIFSFST